MAGTGNAHYTFMTMTYMSFILCCILTDLKKRKIYNIVTFPAMFLGVFFHWSSKGTEGILFSFYGILAGFFLLYIPYALRGIGAGDLKFMMGCGAFSGAEELFLIFLAGSVLGFFASIFTIFKTGGKDQLFVKTAGIANMDFLKQSVQNTPREQSIPYGVFFGTGSLILFFWRAL